MCPTGIVLTDSPYGSATDTLAENRVQKYEKSQNGCSLKRKKSDKQDFAWIADSFVKRDEALPLKSSPDCRSISEIRIQIEMVQFLSDNTLSPFV